MTRRLRRLAFDLGEPGIDADLGATAQDLLEVDRRRRVPADDHDGQAGGPALARGEGRDVLGDRRPDLGRDRAPLEETGLARRRHGHARSAARRLERFARARRCRLPRGCRRPAARCRGGASPTRAVSSPRYSGSSMEGRLTRTFAAAPLAAASPSSAATLRSDEALALLRRRAPPRHRPGSTHSSTHASGTSAAPRAASLIAWLRAAISCLRVARAASSPHRTRHRTRRPRRPAPGSASRRVSPVSIAQVSRSSCSAYLGRPVESARPSRRGPRRGRPPRPRRCRRPGRARPTPGRWVNSSRRRSPNGVAVGCCRASPAIVRLPSHRNGVARHHAVRGQRRFAADPAVADPSATAPASRLDVSEFPEGTQITMLVELHRQRDPGLSG